MMSGNDSVFGPGYADVGHLGLGLQQGRPREGGKAPERGQLPGQAEYGAGHDGQRPGGGRGSVGGEDSGKTARTEEGTAAATGTRRGTAR